MELVEVLELQNEARSKAFVIYGRPVLKKSLICTLGKIGFLSTGHECRFLVGISCRRCFSPFGSRVLQGDQIWGSNFVSSKFRRMVWNSRGPELVVSRF